jgi:hypothetical protein
MNQNLQAAFEQVAYGREALNDIRDFHNSTWMRAFVETFDHIESLKYASERDAATLGILFIDVVGSLIDQLIEEPENRLSLGTLCAMMSYAGRGLSTAKRFFEYVLSDLSAQFQEEREKRLTHTPEVVALLKRDGDLLGEDLSKYFVYGSFNRPMDSTWARIQGAVYIQTDKWKTGYHTYVAVPELLENETVARYELRFVSGPQSPSECDLLTLRGIPIEVDG